MEQDTDTAVAEKVEDRSAAQARHLAATRNEALTEGPARDAMYARHPVVKNSLRLLTPPVKEVYDIAEQVIVHHDPGVCFTAGFRMGKTRALGCVRGELAQTFPDIPSATIIAKGHDDPREGEFYSDILEDYRNGAARTGKAGDRKNRILALWEAGARAKGSDRYLLFVDEAQNWREAQFTWLRDLTNVMAERNVEIQTLMFAHTELLTTRATLQSKRRTDLIGRFLLSPREFRGLRDPAELEATLGMFDDPARHCYPEESGIALSQFFLPKAFQHGWRLRLEARSLWAAMVEVAGRTGQTPGNVGMQWVMSSIRNFLFANISNDSSVFTSTMDAWIYAVEASGYENSLNGGEQGV